MIFIFFILFFVRAKCKTKFNKNKLNNKKSNRLLKFLTIMDRNNNLEFKCYKDGKNYRFNRRELQIEQASALIVAKVIRYLSIILAEYYIFPLHKSQSQ